MPADDPLPLADLPPVEGQPLVRCRGCGRPLTGPAKRRGWGDDCWAKLDQRSVPRPGRFEVEQDQLPGA